MRGWFPLGEEEILRVLLSPRFTWYPGDSYERAFWGVSMITPEIGLACRMGEDQGLFVEPPVAFGAPIALYDKRWRTIEDVFHSEE